MRSVSYARKGNSSTLEITEREVPVPRAREVRVRIFVSGVNPTDWKSRAAVGMPMPFPEVVPNHDGAGIVDAVGDDVEDLQVGDRVWVFFAAHERPTGTAQQFTVIPESRAVRLPSDVPFDVAASLGVPAITAHRALTVHEHGPARLYPGSLSERTVLVHGGAGAVGHAAIQLAIWAGAKVLTTVSSDAKAELASAAGAHQVFRYPDERLAERILEAAPRGVDHIVEVSPAVNAALDVAVLANHGSIAYYANDKGESFTAPIMASFAKNARWQGILLYTVDGAAVTAAAEDITAALGENALPVGEEAGLPLTWFTLDEAGAAHDAVERGTIGKVLIRVAEEDV